MYPCLAIAFQHGDARKAGDDLIMLGTWGAWVHTELILVHSPGRFESFAALDTGRPTPGAGFARSARRDFSSSPLWRVYVFPVLDLAACQGVLVHTLSCGLAYNSKDLWECCVEFVLPMVQNDLDCERPESWSRGVFCSQVALLLLRRMQRVNAIAAPPSMRAAIERVHSRGCSPNYLQSLLAMHQAPLDRATLCELMPA